MQKIDGENEEEEEIIGMKIRNWRKIKLSLAIELSGQEGDNIRATDTKEGDNNKMKDHPIMSKIANYIVAVENKCNTVKVMSSKKKIVLDSKAYMDSWSINEVNHVLPIQLQRIDNQIYR
jgi:hypothetical protein